MCQIIDWSLFAKLNICMALCAGIIWKQPIFNMVTPLHSCRKVVMQSVIQFFNARGIKLAEIYSRILVHSPDLASYDYHLSWPLKMHRKDVLFHQMKRLRWCFMNAFNTSHNISSLEIQVLVQHWSKCIECNWAALKTDMHSFLVVCEIERLKFSFEWLL
jgi:hypothetical protein